MQSTIIENFDIGQAILDDKIVATSLKRISDLGLGIPVSRTGIPEICRIYANNKSYKVITVNWSNVNEGIKILKVYGEIFGKIYLDDFSDYEDFWALAKDQLGEEFYPFVCANTHTQIQQEELVYNIKFSTVYGSLAWAYKFAKYNKQTCLWECLGSNLTEFQTAIRLAGARIVFQELL